MAKLIENTKAQLRKCLPSLTNRRIAMLSKPFTMAPKFMQLHILNKSANELFKQAIANGELAFLEGNYVNVDILEMDLEYCISLEDERLEITESNSNPDATFRFAPIEGILIASGEEDPDTLFFQRKLIVEGNTELGLEVKNFLGAIDMDEMPRAFYKLIKLAAERVQK